MSGLIQHHVKYKEIHGVDEIKLMTMSEHVTLHRRLRKEGKCRISAKLLNNISVRARKRTQNDRDYYNKFWRFSFSQRLIPYIQLQEIIIYNGHNNNISCHSCFHDSSKKHKTIYYVSEKRE